MQSFLDKVVSALIDFPAQRTLVIFPTRRACTVFRDQYALQLNKISWLPTILPIKELLDELSPVAIPDDQTLLLELFQVYRKNFDQIKIDTFLNWGEQVLDDFNEIDRQMVNADQLFQRITDIKILEATFEPGSEEAAHFQEFWSNFSKDELSPLKEQFLGYWEMLPVLYDLYKKHLLSKEIAYEGLAWKLAAEINAKHPFFERFEKVVFAGFYALTQSEEAIMRGLEKTGKAVIFRDADPWYADPKFQEAGLFFRKGFLANNSFLWKEPHLAVEKKDIRITGVNGRASMARELAISLHQELLTIEPSAINKTLVVLPDDGLLFPLLDHCSRLGIPVNPSMGFPLAHHPIVHLLQTFKLIRKQIAEVSGSWFLKEQASWMLVHPLLQPRLSSDDERLLKALIDGSEGVNGSAPIADLLLLPPLSIEQEEKMLVGFLHCFDDQAKDSFPGLYPALKNTIEQLMSSLRPFVQELNLNAWWKLLMSALAKVRIPFRSNREGGIQIMGFLETRVLDYSHVFIASLNEGTLPSGNVSSSLIPYSLRKAFRLPCKEEQDAVTAYHFYRLLQRPSEIRLFYNSDLNDMGGGERSRYLYQLYHELKDANANATFSFFQIEQKPEPPTHQPIIIEKSEAVINALKAKFLYDPQNLKRPGFSASVLNSYIACPLRFYLDQIAGIRPRDEQQGLETNEFGKVFHAAMHDLYKDHEQLSALQIENLIPQVEEFINTAIKNEFTAGPLSGLDFLMQGVLVELAKRILRFDLSEAPLLIKGLEVVIQNSFAIENIGEIGLKGTLDRVDEKNGLIRILDYKTGNDDLKFPEDFMQLFADPAFKTTFQLLFYVYLYKKQAAEIPMVAGLFQLKQFSEEINYLNKKAPVSSEILESLELGLKTMIIEIFNSKIPFSQTTDIERCVYCDFKGLCNRMG
ncbi:PD-(D/E)XK nuclease family protein [soil metagenome]